MLLLLALTAEAAAPDLELAYEVGHVALTLSPGAVVRVLPRGPHELRYVQIRDNDLDLAAQLEGRSARWLLGTDATSFGGGTWMLSLHLQDDAVGVTASWKEDGVLDLTLAPEPRLPPPPEEEVPSLDDLLEGRAIVTDHDGPDALFAPLAGMAWTGGEPLFGHALAIPDWEAAPRAPEGDTSETRPQQIAAWRRALSVARTPEEQAHALYRLAALHHDAGMVRETMDYLGRLVTIDARWPADGVHLMWAQAAILAGRWDEAREECLTAWRNGAAPGPTAECTGAVAYATGDPALAPVAHTLLAHEPTAWGRLLAGLILMRDGRNDEARAVLEPLATDVELYRLDLPVDLITLALGDLDWWDRDYDGAARAWTAISSASDWQPLVQVRLVMHRVMAEPPSDWIGELQAVRPWLDRTTDEDPHRRLGAAEALHLEAQVHALLGDTLRAASSWDTILDRWGPGPIDEVAGAALAEACAERLEVLYRADAPLDHTVFFHDCWREELDTRLVDPRVLGRVSESFERLGFLDRASDALRRQAALFTRSDQDDARVLLDLADLYARQGLPDEALRTLDFATRIPEPPSDADVAIGRARAHRIRGEDEDVIREATLARRSAELRAEADALVALTEAGRDRCDRALPRLDPTGLPEALAGEVSLARIRCRLARGDDDGALAEARALLVPEADPVVAERAAWLAGLAGHERDVEVPETTDDVAKRLLADDAESRAIEAALESRIR